LLNALIINGLQIGSYMLDDYFYEITSAQFTGCNTEAPISSCVVILYKILTKISKDSLLTTFWRGGRFKASQLTDECNCERIIKAGPCESKLLKRKVYHIYGLQKVQCISAESSVQK